MQLQTRCCCCRVVAVYVGVWVAWDAADGLRESSRVEQSADGALGLAQSIAQRAVARRSNVATAFRYAAAFTGACASHAERLAEECAEPAAVVHEQDVRVVNAEDDLLEVDEVVAKSKGAADAMSN